MEADGDTGPKCGVECVWGVQSRRGAGGNAGQNPDPEKD